VAKEGEHRMQSSNENPPFEQIGKPQWDPSGVFHIRYGSGLNDPRPFVLTVTLPYVARELGRSVSFAEISKYVEQNADKLKATARGEQKQAVGRSRGGRNTKIHALADAKDA
jgi:hypothetical protein